MEQHGTITGDAAPAGAGAEAAPAFRRALERLVGDEGYRAAAMADPDRVAADYGLDPGQLGLLGAVCWAAYAPEVAGHYGTRW